jgi:hypothetical protein
VRQRERANLSYINRIRDYVASYLAICASHVEEGSR